MASAVINIEFRSCRLLVIQFGWTVSFLCNLYTRWCLVSFVVYASLAKCYHFLVYSK